MFLAYSTSNMIYFSIYLTLIIIKMIITHIDIFKSRDIFGRKTATIHFFSFFSKESASSSVLFLWSLDGFLCSYH